MPFAKKVISGGSGISKDDIDKINKGIEDRFNALTSSQQQASEVIDARDGETSLKARLDRDIEKAKQVYVNVEGSHISTDSSVGYAKDVEILGNTIQDASNLADIRSVGDKVEGQELYEIPVLSVGKNLNKNQEFGRGINYDGSYNPIGGNNVTNYCNVKENMQYTTSINGVLRSVNQFYYDKDKRFISKSSIPNSTFATPQGAKYVRFTFGTTQEGLCQLEEGTQATQYEPYQEDKLTILSPVQLEKVGDVADRIICKDGVWGVEKNNIDLDINTVNISVHETPDTNTVRVLCSFENIISPPSGDSTNIVCNCFIPNKNYNLDEEGLFIAAKNDNAIYIRINKSKLSDDFSVSNISKYLVNNIKVLKVNAKKPQFIPLPRDQQIKLRTFANKTNISFGCEIEGTIKAQVPKSLGATVNTHTEQINNLNKELDRVKKLEESTVSTVETESDFTTVEATSNGYFEDVKLEGKTLVNLAPNYEINYTASADFDGFRPLLQNTYGTESLSVGRVVCDIKPNTEYTIICNVVIKESSENYLLNNPDVSCVFNDTMTINNTGIHIFKAFSNKELTTVQNVVLRSQNTYGRGAIHIKDITILEGDHTQNPPSYFEGLMSVGQDVEEVSVESVNENLYTFSSLRYASLDSVRLGKHYTHTYNILNTPSNRVFGGIFKLPKSNHRKLYIKCGGYRFAHSFTDKDGILLRDDGWEHNDIPISPLIGEEYLVIYICREDGQVMSQKDLDFIAQNAVIRYADNFSDIKHTPHQSDKKRLLYYNNETQAWEKPILREWDSIEKHANGKYYYHQRSGEVVLNGSEKWSLSSDLDSNGLYFGEFSGHSSLIKKGSYLICNTLQVRQDTVGDKIAVSTTNYGIMLTGERNIRIKNSSCTSLDSLKQWIQANNVTVVYQLAQEKIYECTNIDLITYANETNYVVESGAITPKTTLKVMSNISNVVRELQIKVSTLESYIQYTILNALKNALNE